MASNIKGMVRIEFNVGVTAGGAGAVWATPVLASDLTAQLARLGFRGRLLTVKGRFRTESGATATNATFYLVSGATLAAAPDDLDVFYKSSVIAAPTESATTADLVDDLEPVGAAYVRDPDIAGTAGDLAFGFTCTAGGAGLISWAISIIAEVWL
jgi:hypothetical protein